MRSLRSRELLGVPRAITSLLLLLALLLVADIAAAKESHDAAQRLQALNSEAIEAYRRGAYAEGIVAAEQALALARKALGLRHRDTSARADTARRSSFTVRRCGCAARCLTRATPARSPA